MAPIFERMLSNIAATPVTAPVAAAIELDPERSHWRLMLATQVSAAATPSNVLKVASILETWLVGKWPALRDDPGLDRGSLVRHEADQNVRYEVNVQGLAAELIQRSGNNVWVTTVCAKAQDGRLTIDVQNGVYCKEEEHLTPTVPAFVRKVIEALEAVDGDIPVTIDGYTVEDDETFEQLLDDLNSEERQLPLVAIAPVDAQGNYCVDVDELAKWLYGVAHVVALTRESAAMLREYAGETLSVPRGGARIYMPGFYVNASAELHPVFFMPQAVRSGAMSTHRGLQAHIKNTAFAPEFRLVRSPQEMTLAA